MHPLNHEDFIMNSGIDKKFTLPELRNNFNLQQRAESALIMHEFKNPELQEYVKRQSQSPTPRHPVLGVKSPIRGLPCSKSTK